MQNSLTHRTFQAAEPVRSMAAVHLRVLVLAAAFWFACRGALALLVRSWQVRDVYSYGFLVPFISLFIVWNNRDALGRLRAEPSIAAGLALTLAGILGLAAGNAGSTAIVEELSVIILIPGLVLTILGRKYLKALSFPLSYLVLTVPILDGAIGRSQWPFQLFSAEAASRILAAWHIPTYRNLQYLELPGVTLHVAGACSGLRYLVSSVVLSIPLGYLTQKRFLPRALLVAYAAAASVIANPVRVALIGFWQYYMGGEVHGPFHLLEGYVLYMFILATLFILALVLGKTQSLNRPESPRHEAEAGRRIPRGGPGRAWAVAVALLALTGLYLQFWSPRPVPLKNKKALSSFPLDAGGWHGRSTAGFGGPIPVSGADSRMARVYASPSGREITLRAGYFESQGPEKKFIRGAIRGVLSSREITIGQGLKMNQALVEDGARKWAVLYWYDLNGRTFSSKYLAKLSVTLDGAIYRRTNGAIAVISSHVDGRVNDRDLGAVEDDEISLAQAVAPVLCRYLP